MARTYTRAVKRLLHLTSHAPGTFPTPSAPGSPPSWTTGNLSRSVWPSYGVTGGVYATASVAPHTIYAAVQEYGDVIWRRRARYMTWVANGQRWYRVMVKIPERPYMRPALRSGIATGSLSRAAASAFSIAIWGRPD